MCRYYFIFANITAPPVTTQKVAYAQFTLFCSGEHVFYIIFTCKNEQNNINEPVNFHTIDLKCIYFIIDKTTMNFNIIVHNMVEHNYTILLFKNK